MKNADVWQYVIRGFYALTSFIMIMVLVIIIVIKLWPLQFMEKVETSIKRTELIVDDLYAVGNYNTSVVALSRFSNELYRLKPYAKTNKKLDQYLNEELGITHARLFKLYTGAGEDKIADLEFRKAFVYLGKKYRLNSKNEMLQFIEQIDIAAFGTTATTTIKQ